MLAFAAPHATLQEVVGVALITTTGDAAARPTLAELHRVIADMEHSLSWRKSEYNMLTHNWCVARKASQPLRERPAGQSCPPPPRALMIAPHHGSGCDAPT